MTTFSADQISEVLQRVLSEVGQEAQTYEKAFAVTDLRSSVAELGKVGGQAAWTISYSTRSADVARIAGGQAAWTISYSTRSASIDRGQSAE